MAPKIEAIGRPVGLGEGPYWDEKTQILYFVDIHNHSIHSYNSKTNEHHTVIVETGGHPVSLIIKIIGEDNKFVISVKNNLAIVCWDGVSSKPLIPETLLAIENQESTTRLNDGKCDPSYRLWAGTMGAQVEGTCDQFDKGKGSLYLIRNKDTFVKKLPNIHLSNGLAWSLDRTKFYYIDTLKHRVDSYDYDDDSGNISNEKTIFSYTGKKDNREVLLDGMTIDEEGMLWIACFGGGKVLRIDPATGELKDKLSIPSPQITSVTFGGPDYEDLYVTSAKVAFTKEMEEKYPFAGFTFKITGLGVKGTPSTPVQL